jgi:hypothetical protein
LQKQIFAVSITLRQHQPVVRACCIKRPPVFTSRCCKLVSDHSRLPAARAVASGDGFHQHAENMRSCRDQGRHADQDGDLRDVTGGGPGYSGCEALVRNGVARDDSARPISLFIPSLVGGGAERSMLNLAKAFAACGHRVELVCAERKALF